MRSILVPLVALLSFGCSRDVQTTSAQGGFVAPPSPATQLQLLPGDLVSWLQADPPRLVVHLLDVDEAAAPEVLASLVANTRLFNREGASVELKASRFGVPFERLPNSEAPNPPGVEFRPTSKLGAGWYRLEIDVSATMPVVPTNLDLVAGGRLSARFNVESAPTVRRVWVCPALGQFRVQFSEPMVMGGTGLDAVGLWAESGAPADCQQGLKKARLDADGELLVVQCEKALPRALEVKLYDWAIIAAATKKPLLALDGKPFARLLSTEKLPSAQVGDEDCRLFVP